MKWITVSRTVSLITFTVRFWAWFLWVAECVQKWTLGVWPLPLKKGGGTRVLVPGHQKSGALSSWPTVFCFNFKNGLQSFEFLLFAKCIYVFYTKPGFIRTRSAWMSVQWRENPKKIGGGTRVLVPGHQNSGACYLPDCLYSTFF